jgi:hypothetical protein
MSRQAMLDPTLIKPTSDKRKAPSLVVSLAVKKKRTSKKLLIQVRTPSLSEHNTIHHSNHLYLSIISDQTQQPVVITDCANASSTGKIFTILFFNLFSSLALIPYLLVAEETLVSHTMGSSSPHHDSIPASPRIKPSFPQPEVSASPRNHQVSPQRDIQEPSLEPEKLPSPIREARNDVSMNTHLFYFHLMDHY